MPGWEHCGCITLMGNHDKDMKSNIVRLRGVCIFVLLVCIVAVTCALAAVTVSLVRPAVELRILYGAWRALSAATFGFVAFYLAMGLTIQYLRKRAHQERSIGRFSDREMRFLQAVVVLCVALVLFSWNALYVRPSGAGWIAVSKSGTWEIPEAQAREYLWRDTIWSAVIILGPGSALALFARSLIPAKKSS
jgi:hypothetical protein